MTAFYEVDDDQSIVRSIEIFPDGVAYSYDLEHCADQYGFLPDAPMDVAMASEFGTMAEISEVEFERFWTTTKFSNR
jgi:hypothetical protein